MRSDNKKGNQQAIQRTFRKLSAEDATDIHRLAALLSPGMPGVMTWPVLLQSPRILIIAEAGAGKTYECQQQQEELKASGEPAFFLELAVLAQTELLEMFDHEGQQQFETWLSSESAIATFFLDAIDELKLTLGSFEQALRRLNRALKGQLARARIVITTRPIRIEQQLIEKYLPVPKSAAEYNASTFAAIAIDPHQIREEKEEVSTWLHVGLMPLNNLQIREMAIRQRVVDVEGFMEDIHRRNAEEFARRPQDLIELCSSWAESRRIRTHREQVAHDIAIKLRPNPDRSEHVALSDDKALEGARKLALAALLSRKLTLRHSAESNLGDAGEQALDVNTLLSDWTKDERQVLLERPLFGFASYGRVRFHHRSVIEYLAAEQIRVLLEKGLTVKAAKRLLFTRTMQGNEVIRPTMRPVAAWLAGCDPRFFDEVVRREPEVLLNSADPQQLDPHQRQKALQAYVDRYGCGGWRGLEVPEINARRFVSTDLSELINKLWQRGIENKEIRVFLLKLIEAGPLPACEHIPREVALADETAIDERYDAVDALVALNSPALQPVVLRLETRPDIWNGHMLQHMICRLFPGHMDMDQLLPLLMRTESSAHVVSDLSWRLPGIVSAKDFPESLLEPLRERLTECILDGALWDKTARRKVVPRVHLVAALAQVCSRLLENGERKEHVFRSVAVAFYLRDEYRYRNDAYQNLRAAIDTLSGRERESLFWASDALSQVFHPEEDAFQRMLAATSGGAITPEPERDSEWIIACLTDKQRPLEDREMLLEVAIRFLYPTALSFHEYLEHLKSCVADTPALVADLDKVLQRRHVFDPVFAESERQSALDEQQRNDRKAQAMASWIDLWNEISDNPDRAFSQDCVDTTIKKLWHVMESTESHGRATGWNRAFLENHFGKETADRVRAALIPFWRRERPGLGMEVKPEDRNVVYRRWQLGFAAIFAESEDPDWARKLSPAEAENAARYVPIGYGSFPSWLEALVIAHPTAVSSTLGAQLTFELTLPSPSPILHGLEYATPAIAAIFVPCLRQWLEQNVSSTGNKEDPTRAKQRLKRVLDVLIQHGDPEAVEQIRLLARKRLRRTGVRFESVWVAALLQLEPTTGVEKLERILAKIPVSKDSAALDWFGELFDTHHLNAPVNLSLPGFTPELLLRLVRLAYTHIRREDDPWHEGSWTPDRRDYAQSGRGVILSALLNTTGSSAWSARIALSQDPLFADFSARALAIALEKAAQEADSDVLSEGDIAGIYGGHDLPPASSESMFALLCDRLDDLDELLLSDVSPRESWAGIRDERVMRRVIARELRNSARKSYTVDQESATADEKETDIRLRSLAGPQAVIELKIGEKPRSANDLRAALSDQLVNKYMASEECRAGCLMITIASDKNWKKPEDGKKMDFAQLIEWLNDEAMRLVEKLGYGMQLKVKGVDLRPRLATEKDAKRVSPRKRGRAKGNKTS